MYLTIIIDAARADGAYGLRGLSWISGRFNIVVALAIATLKATLVVLFFMHAKYSPKRTKLVIMAGIFWLMHSALHDPERLHFPRGLSRRSLPDVAEHRT